MRHPGLCETHDVCESTRRLTAALYKHVGQEGAWYELRALDGLGQETHRQELYCAYARGADPRIVWYIDCCHTTVALRQRVAMKVDSGKFAFLSGWQVAALCLRERAECVTAALLNFQGQEEAPRKRPCI